MATQDPRRFIGRKAAACRKCGGCFFYVNPLGGIVCQSCVPPVTSDGHSVAPGCVGLRLVVSDGVWDDADNPFDPDANGAALAATSVSAVAFASPGDPVATPGHGDDPRLLAMSLEQRQRWILDAARHKMRVSDLLAIMGAVFSDQEAEFGWSPEPTWVRMDRLMRRIRDGGMKVVW